MPCSGISILLYRVSTTQDGKSTPSISIESSPFSFTDLIDLVMSGRPFNNPELATAASGVAAAGRLMYCFSGARYIQVCSPSLTIVMLATWFRDSMRIRSGRRTDIELGISILLLMPPFISITLNESS